MYRDNLNYKYTEINSTTTFYTLLTVVYVIFFFDVHVTVHRGKSL